MIGDVPTPYPEVSDPVTCWIRVALLITPGVTGFAVTVTCAAGTWTPLHQGDRLGGDSDVRRRQATGSGVTGLAVTWTSAAGIWTNPPGCVGGRVNRAGPRRLFGRIRDRNTRGLGAATAPGV